MVCSCVVPSKRVLLQIIFCSCVIGTMFSREKWQIASLSCQEVIKIWKQTWWSTDKTIIELGYRKISWFISVSQINYWTRLSKISWYFAQPRPIIVNCVIVWVRVVLKRTVVGDWRFDNLSGSHLQSQVNSICQSMTGSSFLNSCKLKIKILMNSSNTINARDSLSSVRKRKVYPSSSSPNFVIAMTTNTNIRH